VGAEHQCICIIPQIAVVRVEEVHTRSRSRRRKQSCNKNLNSGIRLQWLLIYSLTCNTVMGTKHEGICFYSKFVVCVCEREREDGCYQKWLVVGEEDVCSKNSNSGTKEGIADAILNKTIHEIRR
jgi:hypothetical protein